ncbi:MAG TPA: PAS domain-containing protein [Candidatus Fermentibacter daniensis]|nr:PAS domain-containing protein [Candidatus Fermentibacter daniensis]
MDEGLGRIYFEACPEALMAIRDGRVLRANDEMCRLLGIRSSTDIEGRRLEEIIPMDLDNRVGLYSALTKLLPGDVRTYEWDLMLPGGVFIPVIIRATGLGGGVLLLSIRDYTEGRRQSQALLEMEEQRRALLEVSAYPVFCIDREFRILWCNASLGELAGARPGALLRRTCHRMLYGQDIPCLGCPAMNAMRSRSTCSNGMCGTGIRYRASTSSFNGPDGGVAGAVVAILETPAGGPGSTVGTKPSAETPSAPADRHGGLPGGETSEGGGNSAATAMLNLTEWLASSLENLKTILGSTVSVSGPRAAAPAAVSPEHLLEAFRTISHADFGSCLAGEEGIAVRVDRTRLEPGLPGIDPGSYYSVSLGARPVLEGAEGDLFSRSPHNRISPFPMPSAQGRGRESQVRGRSGAVFVSRTDGDRRFYQIMIPVPEQGSGID